MRAYSLKLPSVIFSDNCQAFSYALDAAPVEKLHILCIWHLLDNKSVKTRVAGLLRAGFTLASISYAVYPLSERGWSRRIRTYVVRAGGEMAT